MQKMNIPKDLPNQKYLTPEDGRMYYQLGRNTLMKVATEANAIRKIGRRVLIDRAIVDAFLDAQTKEND